MPSSPPSSIAIIGASITGLSLTLSLLHADLFPISGITLYDIRSPTTSDPANSSGVILTPNGLSILDSLGILSRFREKCWLSEYRTYKNARDETTRKVLIANERLYGFRNHRVWRRTLLDALMEMVREKGVRIQWESRFEGVVREGEDGVVFRINGREETAGMLVGADGIHSSVRRYVTPEDGEPEYTGIAGVLSHIPWNSVSWPYEDYERACTIQDKPGALVLMPENREGSVIMVAMQAKVEDRSREEWEELGRDKSFLREFFAKGRDQWESTTAKAIIDAVCRHEDTLYMWPYMRLGRLRRWSSERTGRVLIIGDAAHALPPSSGQGVNQALEDIHALTKLLVLLNSNPSIARKDALEFWQTLRQARIDAVLDWATNRTNVQRMPLAEREKLVREGKVLDASNTENFDDMRWLYLPDTDKLIGEWAARYNN
ncbi:hypothetical protein H2200_010339 [Cladophialophora chaetospira]|uniref:FAD-binding domain-containing protein n=1 Tax=Cladophialophora chaetospira TaxID=386627 RepID=A0AA38X198_9EURO|nr:hypothetical protein H2200_010339 [Cladophialophora chaetospira]